MNHQAFDFSLHLYVPLYKLRFQPCILYSLIQTCNNKQDRIQHISDTKRSDNLNSTLLQGQ